MSLASEPPEQKSTCEGAPGAISFSFSASSMAKSWLLPPKRWENDRRDICSRAASVSSSTP